MKVPDLKSPSKQSDNNQETNTSRKGTLVYVLIGIIICLSVIIIALLIAPKKIVPKETEYQSIEKDIKPVEIKKEITTIAKKEKEKEKEKEINEQVEIDWMLKKSQAEEDKLPVWASEDYEKALVIVNKGYENNESEIHFNEAISIIDEIYERKEVIFNELLSKGKKLIDSEELLKAEQILLKAQAIEINNKEVNRSLERIKNRNKVNELYEDAIEKEKNNQLDEAISLLEKAQTIEPEYKKITDKINDISRLLKEYEFNKKVSHILKALDNKNINLAKNELKTIKAFNINKTIINELEIKIEEEIKNIEIKRLKTIAKKQEKNELWKRAKKTYKKILNYNSNVNGIIVNEKRVDAYIYLNKLIDNINHKPERLQKEKILNQAKQSIKYVRNEIDKKNSIYYSKNKTPKLIKKISLAEKIVNDASTIINVKIRSDNKTNIIIYKVAKIGKISETSLELRPGKYTIVGSRTGYVDYREIIKITADDHERLITVQCREKI